MQTEPNQVWHPRDKYRFGMVKKTWNFGLEKRNSNEKESSPKTYISELEKKIRRMEAEKEVLNRAIDIADDLLNTEIRKKYLPLSQVASGKQREAGDVTPLEP